MDEHRAFSCCLLDRRVEANLSVSSLAAHMGVSCNTIHNWEEAKTWPTVGQLLRLARVLGCSPTDLLPKEVSNAH